MSPTEALTALGMQPGTLVTMRDGAESPGDATSAVTPPPRPSDAGTFAVDLDPLALLTRLCASVPPPRFHTVRYAGVLPRSRASAASRSVTNNYAAAVLEHTIGGSHFVREKRRDGRPIVRDAP
jgi:hypothetical protein